MKRASKLPVRVVVEWVDSAMWVRAWEYPDEIIDHYKENGQQPMLSTGWLVDETKTYLIVASQLQLSHSGEVERIGGIWSIPKGCIKRVHRMKAGR